MFSIFKRKKQSKEDISNVNEQQGVQEENKETKPVVEARSKVQKNKKGLEPEKVLSVEQMKINVLDEYTQRMRMMRPGLVVRSVTVQYRFITLIYTLSLLMFLAGMYVVWMKNLDVDVVYQRIDGVTLDLPNDARSRVLMTKVLQDAKVQNPTSVYRLDGEKDSQNER